MGYESNMLKPFLDRNMIAPEYTMGVPMSGMINPYQTNYLGGITMSPGLTQDTYVGVQREKQKNMNVIKTAFAVIGGITLFCALRGKGEKLVKWFKGLFKSNNP